MKVSPMLTKILSEALLEAKKSHHEFLTPEHVLISALHNDFVIQLLNESGCDTASLISKTSDYIATKVPVISETANEKFLSNAPVESAGFQAVMNRAVFHCVSSESDFLDVTDIIVSMYEESRNYCSYFLRTTGTDKIKLLQTITKIKGIHGTKKPSKNIGMGLPPEMSSNNEGGLQRFAVNLTEMAKNGAFDALIGREDEIERTIQILCRRSKNNPLHVGDAGVGKTAITQGLAQRIVQNKVPEFLKGTTIYSLDIGLLLAGSKFRGDFEERIHNLVDELRQKKNTILFIDEIHMIMGAGTNGSTQIDAANLLKPALSDGSIRVIGSTTYEEYHKVKYTPASLETAVDLSIQYISEKRLPDKAIDLMDEAGAWQKINKKGGTITPATIKKVTAKIAKLPVDTVEGDEKAKLKTIEESLQKEIFGQNKAIVTLAKAVKRARAGFRNPEKPEACYLFVGPTGCGKTELAKSLAKLLGEPLLRYDMSEYQEKHSVSRLVGSPPGYVGFEEGGQLVKDIRKNPNSIVLFDEIEKAHEDIYNILLQVMDYGILTDNQGRKADFRNCMIIMTSNAGARDMEKPGIGFGTESDQDNEATLTEAVNKEFSPEFRNRLDAVIPFKHLNMDVVKLVCEKEIQKLSVRMAAKKVMLSVTKDCVAYLTEQGYSREFGARNMARTIEDKLANALVDEVLFGKLEKGGNVTADYENEEVTFSYE